MAYTFLKAKGYEIGKSLVDDTKIDYCKEMMEKAEKLGKKLLLPVDSVTIADFPNPIDAPVEVQVYDVTNMPADREGCDIGPKTAALYAEAVKTAKTVVWNGPMGVFENPTLAARSDRHDDPRAFPRNDRRSDGRRPDQRSDRRSGDRRQDDAPRRGRGRRED